MWRLSTHLSILDRALMQLGEVRPILYFAGRSKCPTCAWNEGSRSQYLTLPYQSKIRLYYVYRYLRHADTLPVFYNAETSSRPIWCPSSVDESTNQCFWPVVPPSHPAHSISYSIRQKWRSQAQNLQPTANHSSRHNKPKVDLPLTIALLWKQKLRPTHSFNVAYFSTS